MTEEENPKTIAVMEMIIEGHRVKCVAATVNNQLMFYIQIRDVCEIFGVNPEGQIERIRNHHALRKGLVKVDIPGEYGEKGAVRVEKRNAISANRFHAWLTTISVERLDVDEETKQHLYDFQDAAADVLYAFFGRQIVPNDILEEQEANLPVAVRDFYAAMDQARMAMEKVDAVENKVLLLDDRLSRLEIFLKPHQDEEIITKPQQRQFQKWVAIIGDLLEKKGIGNAGTVHNELKDQFGYPKYTMLPQRQFEDVRKYLIQWYKKLTPPGTPIPMILQEPSQKNMF